ncbi:transferrin-binding protein-like solute binding protein [Neptunomonas sp.]|uniref:transferrin-binding protein-like solute binding protein n=1 Tax=Neptunomonas sp. TaxID=1971898 RepID=UPI003562D138
MNKKQLFIPLSVFATSVLLVGCGGGGSSSVKTSGPGGFPILGVNNSVVLDAISAEVDYTSAGNFATSTTDIGIVKTSTAELVFDNKILKKLIITTPNSTLTWDAASGDTFKPVTNYPRQTVFEDSASTFAAVLSGEWDYQTFGAWRTGFGLGAGIVGAVSAGYKTDGPAVPVVGKPTFTGKLLGAYTNEAGVASFVEGVVSVASDFSARSLAFTTSASKLYNLSNGVVTSVAPDLNMSGTLTYSPGVNSFSGAVAAPGAGMTGSATGAFYGPNAEELGGVFDLQGTGVEYYIGGFGATQ